jgi:hypothetical protein
MPLEILFILIILLILLKNVLSLFSYWFLLCVSVPLA